MSPQEPAICPDCGGRIPVDAPRGLCVGCLSREIFFPDGEAPVETEEAAVGGMMFGPWRTLREAGEGAFGLVYEAVQEVPLHRRAALKVLKPGLDSREIMGRFAMERETLAVLDHPGIARVLDAGTDGGRPWIAAEWVEGALPVTVYCQKKGLGTQERVRLFQQVCGAVAHAHQRGIIHRDLKPTNVLVSEDGVAKVIDFGIARATEQVLARSTLVTMAGQVLGTPAYMSPEQAAGRGAEADTRSDIYSLGAVLYELLTGRALFTREKLESASLQEALRLVREEEPVRPSALKAELQGELEWIILRALEKEPARRYETAAALGRDLGEWLDGGTVLAVPPSRGYRLRTFLRRHRTAALGAAAVVVALLAGLAATTLMYLRARAGENEARLSGARAVAGEAAARRKASEGDQQTAQTFFDRGQPVTAVMHLARAVSTDPSNTAAGERLMAELAMTGFPRPAWPPVACEEFIRDAAFSPDSSRLAVHCVELGGGFAPGRLLLLDTATGQPVAQAMPPGVLGFSFCPDGASLAVACADGVVSFHHTVDGAPDARPPLRHGKTVRGLAWGGPQRLTTLEDADTRSTGRLWDLTDTARPRLLHEIPNVQALCRPAWSPDVSQVAWLQVDGTVTVLAAADGRVVSTWKTERNGRVAWTTADLLAVQTELGSLRLYHATTGEPASEPARSSSAQLGIFPSPDGTSLLTTGFDGVATLWDARTLAPLQSLPGRWHFGSFAGHGGLLALGGDLDEQVAFFDMNMMQAALPPLPMPGKSAVAALSPDGTLLACGGRQRRLTLYDLRHRAALPEVRTGTPTAWHVVWGADGRTLSTLNLDGTATTWDAGGKEAAENLAPPWSQVAVRAASERLSRGFHPARDFERSADPVNLLPEALRAGLKPGGVKASALSPDGRWIALADKRKVLRLVSTEAGEKSAAPAPLTLPASAVALAFSRDGARLAASLAEGTLVLVETATMKEITRWQPRQLPALALAFLPDGRLISGGEDGTVALSPGGTQPGSDTAGVRQIEVTQDGRYFATGTQSTPDGTRGSTARLWHAATGRPLTPPLRHQSLASHETGVLLRLSPDGRLLATAGCHDGAVRLWDVPTGEPHGVLLHPGIVTDLAFDAAGRRLASLTSRGKTGGELHCWDVASRLPLTPPQRMPDGGRGLFLSLNPDGTRAVVASGLDNATLFDLPPVLAASPAWLAEAAGAITGWAYGPAGLPVPVSAAVISPGGNPADAVLDTWAGWLLASPETRSASPLGSRTRAETLASLRWLNRTTALHLVNQIQPSPASTLAIPAATLAWSRNPGDRPQAARLARQALARLTPEDPLFDDTMLALSFCDDEPDTFPQIVRLIRARPENPESWDHAASWLQQQHAWIPCLASLHRAAADEGPRADPANVRDHCFWGSTIARDILGGSALLLRGVDLPGKPADDASVLTLLTGDLPDPDRTLRESTDLLNHDPANGFAWWTFAEAAAAIARRDHSPAHKAAAWAAYTGCGARLPWVRTRIADPAWFPTPASAASAGLLIPLNSEAILHAATACLNSQLPPNERLTPAEALRALLLSPRRK